MIKRNCFHCGGFGQESDPEVYFRGNTRLIDWNCAVKAFCPVCKGAGELLHSTFESDNDAVIPAIPRFIPSLELI